MDGWMDGCIIWHYAPYEFQRFTSIHGYVEAVLLYFVFKLMGVARKEHIEFTGEADRTKRAPLFGKHKFVIMKLFFEEFEKIMADDDVGDITFAFTTNTLFVLILVLSVLACMDGDKAQMTFLHQVNIKMTYMVHDVVCEIICNLPIYY